MGDFIELERLIESGEESETIQQELFNFLESLGISKDDQETRGYDTLIRLKNEGKLNV